MGRQTVGSVHLWRRGGALQPLLLQVRRVLPAADVAVTGRLKSRGPAGSRLRCWCHGSEWRRELPAVLYRCGLALVSTGDDVVGRLLPLVNKMMCLFPWSRGHPPAGQSHPGRWLARQGERQRYRELHLCCGKGHEVPARVCKRQRDPSPLAQLAATQRGQRGGGAHIWLPVWPHWKVIYPLTLWGGNSLWNETNPLTCHLLSTATTPLSWDQITPTSLKSSSSSQTELQTNRSRVKTHAANGSQMSSVKYRWAVNIPTNCRIRSDRTDGGCWSDCWKRYRLISYL